MKRRVLLTLSALFGTLSGCVRGTTDYAAWPADSDTFATNDYSAWPVSDRDDDGYDDDVDCDDDDPAVHPGATEVCDNGADDDCDGLIDTADAEDCPG
ncbi:MAG: putative metal-binding motif-containing protein [Pseudomonadota bacterium]